MLIYLLSIYFEKLNNITIGDKIELDYKGEIYIYNVINIWEEQKSGYIHINKHNNNQLILTTCSPENSDKQLVINSIEENKNTSKTKDVYVLNKSKAFCNCKSLSSIGLFK